ncbi:MAG: TonB-dependent receptor [Bacteroidales bacterium]|jgi:iron complex outermembrane receptor protein|nr:TonB-dependent receptor [Bacteroidales bacterium]MCI2121335.1 TonB-dependent receptor [Bacteroidales bacterium]MCI2145914.1 TonB-dependent receptor [Bacteroidales bacterium]
MKRLITLLASILAFSLTSAFAQYTVKGVIVDKNGDPVIGAAVLQQGTQHGTESDLDGMFTLNVPSSSTVLEISFIGYKKITIPASQATRVVLEDDTQFLDEVVVIGYGTVKKNDLTGSVSAVKADDIDRGVVTSPSDLLKGKSAGIVVTSGDGAPGSAATIRIRGGSSLNASNDPLVVVDGLPITNSSIDGVSDQLSSINPNDIESFTVLKDASATAIYGSRASNGVIIITTKKGSSVSSKPKFNFDFTSSLSKLIREVDVMDAAEIKAAMLKYGGSEDYPGYAALGDADTDWQSLIYQLAKSYEANGSVSGNVSLGGNNTLPYRISGGYINETGILKTSAMDRATASVNLSPKFLDNHLTVNLNGKGMYIRNSFANQDAIGQAVEYDPTQYPLYYTGDGATYNSTYRTPFSRTETISDFNQIMSAKKYGNYGYYGWGTTSSLNTQSTCNPIASLDQKKDLSHAKRFIGNAQFDYKVHGFEDLRFNLNLGIDWSASKGTVDVPAGAEQTEHSQKQAGSGYHTDYVQNKLDETLEFYGDYSHVFDKHSVDLMAGYSWQRFYYDSESEQVKATDGDLLDHPLGAGELYLVSFYGRLNYNYDERYFVTATVREDGTSRFANNKWGFFPSVAFSWNLKNEDFLKDNDILSRTKLRLSWGQTGQQDLNSGYYPTLATYLTNTLGSYYYFGDKLIVPITPQGYNADLKWETTTTYNAGIDLGFLDDRIYGSIDAYYRLTTDLLNNTQISAGANLTNYLDANIGSLVNKGVEFEVNAVPYQTRDLYWNIGFNATYNNNKITKLTTNDSSDYSGVATGGINGGVGNNIERYMVGYPVNSFYVYEQIYDTDGKPIQGAYVDRNGDGTVDDKDMYCYKKAAPDFTFGFNTVFEWKKWTLSASAHANLGNYVYDNMSSKYGLMSDLWTNNFVANRLAGTQDAFFTTAQYFSDYYVHNASFLKLDNVTLSYMFDLYKDMKLTVYGTAQNVFCITKYKGIDPEIFSGIDNNMYPRPRTFLLGLKLNF